MPKFQKKTQAVIQALKKKLKSTKSYPTLGHFYREIELLKFPHTRVLSNGGRNVYAGSQYDTIVRYCRTQRWITVNKSTEGRGYLVTSLLYDENTRKKDTVNVCGLPFKSEEVRLELALDPKINWTIRLEGKNSYLSVTQ